MYLPNWRFSYIGVLVCYWCVSLVRVFSILLHEILFVASEGKREDWLVLDLKAAL